MRNFSNVGSRLSVLPEEAIRLCPRREGERAGSERRSAPRRRSDRREGTSHPVSKPRNAPARSAFPRLREGVFRRPPGEGQDGKGRILVRTGYEGGSIGDE